eukprot:TRINITY_DN54490_c0_g1_i1.p1 TRINITY_DN54490_c0_g1~~TRINITY_DN54490_c0_g1_i1.p1  ORF type:complete len:210 (-),score=40.82 TRINITY_DN54490_c0_g1_i1:136-765(-)
MQPHVEWRLAYDTTEELFRLWEDETRRAASLLRLLAPAASVDNVNVTQLQGNRCCVVEDVHTRVSEELGSLVSRFQEMVLNVTEKLLPRIVGAWRATGHLRESLLGHEAQLAENIVATLQELQTLLEADFALKRAIVRELFPLSDSEWKVSAEKDNTNMDEDDGGLEAADPHHLNVAVNSFTHSTGLRQPRTSQLLQFAKIDIAMLCSK